MDLSDRLLILAGLAALIAAGYGLLRLWRARRLESLAADRPFADLLPTGAPAVVAFTLPTCGECRARQAPALRRLADQLAGRAHVATLSAAEHSALADRLGVLTVPATAVVDARGVVRHLNLGFADERRLAAQLAELATP